MSKRQTPAPDTETSLQPYTRKVAKPASGKGTKAVEHAKQINAIDPGRYKMVKKGNKEYPVYVAKLERELARRCTGTNNITGLPCGNPPIKGGTVCWSHGGKLPIVREAANKRLEEAKLLLLEEIEPTIRRLTEIRDQSEHMPSALGASNTILNRTMGKPGEAEKKVTTNFNIKVGVGILSRQRKDVDNITATAVLTESTPTNGEVIEEG